MLSSRAAWASILMEGYCVRASSNTLVRGRSLALVQQQGQDDRPIIFSRSARRNDWHLLAFCFEPRRGLRTFEQGVLLLARTQYPSINIEAHAALLDNMAGELRDRLDLSGEPEHILSTIGEVPVHRPEIYRATRPILRPRQQLYQPRLDRRRGNPIA